MAASLVPAGGKMRKQYSLGAYLSFRVGRLLSRGNVKRECWPEGGQESFASSFLQQCDEEGGGAVFRLLTRDLYRSAFQT